MNNIREIRKTVLPKDIFDLIEGYMQGDIIALHVIAVTKNQTVLNVSAGAIPDYIAANDDDEGTIQRALS